MFMQAGFLHSTEMLQNILHFFLKCQGIHLYKTVAEKQNMLKLK